MGQPVSAGSAYGLRSTLAWPVTWPAPLKSRYVTWGALQVLYAFAFAFHHDFIIYIDFTRIAASTIATDDVTNLIIGRTFNANT